MLEISNAGTASAFERKSSVRRRAYVLWLLAGLLAVSGCSKGLHEVTGTVKFDGKPVPEGDIIFIPDDKAQGPEAGKIKDGKYTVHAKPGPSHVKITANREVPGEKGPMGEPKREDYVPKKYNEETEADGRRRLQNPV